MTSPARRSSWRPPLSLVGIVALIPLICLPVIGPSPLTPFTVAVQGLLLVLVLRGFFYAPQLARWAAAMPVPHRVVFVVLVAAMILGHFTFNNRRFFPLVAWEIFPVTRENDPVVCRAMIATTASGQKVRLLAEQLFPSIVQIDPLDNPAFYPPEKVEELVHACARMHDKLYPGDPIAYVEIVDLAVQLHPPANELRTLPSCTLVKRYEISSAP